MQESEPAVHADLEIRLGAREEGGFPVEITFSGERELATGHLAPEAVLPWVEGSSPAEDGERLFNALFGDPRLREAWAEARGLSRRRRIRLRIDTDEPELHTVPWELLREPAPQGGPGLALAADPATPFSRYLAGAWRPGRPILERPIRLLVAFASPDGLPLHCPPLDLALERSSLEAALAGAEEIAGESAREIAPTFLEPPVTLPRLVEALSQGEGFHLLHLMAHGAFSREQGRAAVYLARDEPGAPPGARGSAVRVPEEELAAALARLEAPLRLIFLASCQTAERDPRDAFGGLAPSLVAAGIPAVVAMQGTVMTETARGFAAAFYRHLLRHGEVDLAVNQARAAALTAQLSGAALPVLFLRLRDGQLLGRRGQIKGPMPEGFWKTLLRNIAEGQCLPLLGPGVTQGLLPTSAEISRRLAREYKYPFPDPGDLPRVAQFVGAYEADLPHREILDLLARSFRQRYDLPPDPRPGRPLSETLRDAGWSALSARTDETEIHHQLADLGLPLYLTTNADSFLALALEARGRRPRREVLAWRGEPRGRRDLDPPPSPEQPVVLHLFGTDEDPSSLVVTEDDHLDFLSRISRDDDNLLPPSVAEALATRTLLFLGYQMHDVGLKILLRGFLSHLDRAAKRHRLQVAVQVGPGEAAQAGMDEARSYLEKYFRSANIDVYWGTVHQFVADLHARWEEAR